MNKRLVIAIDGPAGAGKSSVARQVAHRLGYVYIDTGAMYRAITLLALEQGLDLSNEELLVNLARRTRIELAPTPPDEPIGVRVNGRDVSLAIRQPEVTQAVSLVSSHARLRELMVDQQRRLGVGGGVVMDGRDIGTVVFPQADCKIFLTASVEERARRRHLECESRGIASTLEAQIADIQRRDAYDSSRAASPLVQAPDAVLLDTTGLSKDKVIDRILGIIREAIPQPAK